MSEQEWWKGRRCLSCCHWGGPKSRVLETISDLVRLGARPAPDAIAEEGRCREGRGPDEMDIEVYGDAYVEVSTYGGFGCVEWEQGDDDA